MFTDKEKDILYQLIFDKEAGYGAKIILLKTDGCVVPEIREATNRHSSNIRKWIHHFNEKGLEGIFSKIYYHTPIKIT
ncbi:MAG TPA: hypothetical protein VIY08_01900 [Candidatus Nitrosocosmicus sp.]